MLIASEKPAVSKKNDKSLHGNFRYLKKWFRKTIILFFINNCIDLRREIEAIRQKKQATCVPVFSVEICTNPAAAAGQSFGYSTSVMSVRTEHGDFNLPTGIFTVKTAGIYQLNFIGHVHLTHNDNGHRFDLRVNGKLVALSLNQSSVESAGYQPAVISALMPLESGDKVGVFASRGKIYEETGFYKTRFYGLLLLDRSSD